MEIKTAKSVDIRVLSWAIYKATGLNLGGWNNQTGTPQTGSLSWSELGGLTVTCPDNTLPATVAQIEVLIAGHNALVSLPADFPPEPLPAPPPPDPAIAISAAASDVVTEIDKAFTARATALTPAEKTAMRDRVVALIARAQER